MYVLKLDKNEDIKIYKELKKNKALISICPYWNDNYDYFLFNKKINDKCIEVSNCYQEPYWFYQFDIPEGEWINLDSYDYNSDTGASGISNKRLTSEDMSDGVEILNEQYYDKKIDWDKIRKLLK